ncbi:MAG TPA: hypothetical protein VFN77_01390, partial [Acetobacteraceae bacterium]|nr:hypothetical protein [Acetobacteraceae bacterium]
MSGTASSTTTVTINGGGAGSFSFPMDSNVAPAAQQTLTNDISNVMTAGSPFATATLNAVSLDGNGAPTGGIPTLGGSNSNSSYLYLSGAVTSGGAVTIPAYDSNTNAGYEGIIAAFTGDETITGGGGPNTFLVTGANSNVTYDPQGGTFNDSIFAGGGNNSFTLDGTNYAVIANSGN